MQSNMESYMGFQRAYLDLTLADSKGQGQDNTYFDYKYLKNGDGYGMHY